MISKDDLKDKYVFFDIDGTLAAYRFNDHVSDPLGTSNGMSILEIEDGIFFKRKPSLLMQKVLLENEAKENIALSYCLNEKERSDKNLWLDKYYPMIKKRFLIDLDKNKARTILDYCHDNNILLKDVIFVDDVLDYLKEAERLGIKSYHISSFLDYYMK